MGCHRADILPMLWVGSALHKAQPDWNPTGVRGEKSNRWTVVIRLSPPPHAEPQTHCTNHKQMKRVLRDAMKNSQLVKVKISTRQVSFEFQLTGGVVFSLVVTFFLPFRVCFKLQTYSYIHFTEDHILFACRLGITQRRWLRNRKHSPKKKKYFCKISAEMFLPNRMHFSTGMHSSFQQFRFVS